MCSGMIFGSSLVFSTLSTSFKACLCKMVMCIEAWDWESTGSATDPGLCSNNSRSNREYNMHAQGEVDQCNLSFACFASLHETGGLKTHAAAF